MSEPDSDYTLTVISDRFAGGYAPAVHVGEDVAIPIRNEIHAFAYAGRVIQAAERAVYDEAVFRQMMAISAGEAHTAAALVATLRSTRTRLVDDATDPLRFDPILLSTSRQAEVHVFLRGKPVFALAPMTAIGHAMGVIQAFYVALHDQQYQQVVSETYKAGPLRAAHVVDDLSHYRTESAAWL